MGIPGRNNHKKMKVSFNNLNGSHKCYSKKEGEWIVFRCPHCPDFERRIHVDTKEFKSKISPDNMNLHHGFHIPPGLDADLYNNN